MSDPVHPQFKQELLSLLDSVKTNLTNLEDCLRRQLVPNSEQVFSKSNGLEVSEDIMAYFLNRQRILVTETLIRNFGRIAAAQGGVRELISKVQKFPQEKG